MRVLYEATDIEELVKENKKTQRIICNGELDESAKNWLEQKGWFFKEYARITCITKIRENLFSDKEMKEIKAVIDLHEGEPFSSKMSSEQIERMVRAGVKHFC